MPIEFRCHECNKRIRTADKNAGKKAKCPQCGAVLDIPLGSGLPPDASETGGESPQQPPGEVPEQPAGGADLFGAGSGSTISWDASQDLLKDLGGPSPQQGGQDLYGTIPEDPLSGLDVPGADLPPQGFDPASYQPDAVAPETPQYGAPQYGAPQYGVPQYGAPPQNPYGAPQYTKPGYAAGYAGGMKKSKGPLVLTFGIISTSLGAITMLVQGGVCCCGPCIVLSPLIGGVTGLVSLGFGIPAAVMGFMELGAIKRGEADASAKGTVQTGTYLGIGGPALTLLAIVVYILAFVINIFIFAANNSGGGGY